MESQKGRSIRAREVTETRLFLGEIRKGGEGDLLVMESQKGRKEILRCSWRVIKGGKRE